MIKVLICGINGQMGRVLAKAIDESVNMVVAAGVDVFNDFKGAEFPIYSDIIKVEEPVDVIIDFSRPAALKNNLEFAKSKGIGVVIATTGMSEQDKHLISQYAQKIPIFFSANMSLGVNLQIDLCRQASDFLGSSADIEIVEKHHNTKVDAPSGTALSIAEAINASFADSKNFVYGRHAHNQLRDKNEIGIHSIRGGKMVGEHDVLFICDNEIIEIKHTAESKQVFAVGAMRAAEFILVRPSGLYNMDDIIAETRLVTNITLNANEALISIYDLPSDSALIASIFEAMSDACINIDMIGQSPSVNGKATLSFSLPKSDVISAQNMFSEFEPQLSYTVNENITKINIEGIGMERRYGVASRVFGALSSKDIQVDLITTAETKISLCVSTQKAMIAADCLAQVFKL